MISSHVSLKDTNSSFGTESRAVAARVGQVKEDHKLGGGGSAHLTDCDGTAGLRTHESTSDCAL